MAKEQFGYKIEFNRYCDGSHHSDEEYGDWYESFTNSLESVSCAAAVPDVVSVHDLKSGDRAYLVWAEWSTGDSFGHGDRSSVEAIGLFVDRKCAQELKDGLEATDKYGNYQSSKNVSYKIKTTDGQLFECGFAPWAGYFESLDAVHIDSVDIE